MFCRFFFSIVFAQPLSREAILIESSNPSEVLVMATGVAESGGYQKVNEQELTQRALRDARQTSVWFIVLGGSVLRRPPGKRRDGHPLVRNLWWMGRTSFLRTPPA